MPSSTSRFRAALPGRALGLLAAGLATLALAAAYTVWLNPEIRFFRYSLGVKQGWARTLHERHPAITIIYGTSSCAFSVDAGRLEREHGLPAVNLGLHAGMEALFLTAAAVETARPGDTLIVALEPGMLMGRFESPDLAAQMGIAIGRPAWIHASNLTGERVHWVRDVAALRPGAYHCFTLLGKLALRRPLYRYSPQDVRPNGWQQTPERRPLPDLETVPVNLSTDARNLLNTLKHWGDTNRVRVVYSLPWRYVTAARQREFQQANLRFLRQMVEVLPVLKDPVLGAHSLAEHFSDTEWHLTEVGAAERTDSLAAQLRGSRFWTGPELAALERAARGEEPGRADNRQ